MAQFIHPVITPADVADTTWVELIAANKFRRFLGIYNECASTNIYIAFGDTAPSNITTALRVPAGGRWESNVLELILDKVWCYQFSGSEIDSGAATTDAADAVKVIEGV